MTGEANGTGQANNTQATGAGAAASSQGNQQQGQAAAVAAGVKQGEQQAQGGEAAKAGDAAKGGEAAKAGEQKQSAPEKYTDFKLPDGFGPDQAVLGEFQTLAKGMNLNQADAQKIVDLGAKLAQGVGTSVVDTVAKAKVEWEGKSKADTEFGGEKFAENLGKANEMFAKFGTPELKQLLVDSGLGNHPEVIRWAFRVSKALSEDKVVRADKAAGNQGGTLEERAANKLYGKTGT